MNKPHRRPSDPIHRFRLKALPRSSAPNLNQRLCLVIFLAGLAMLSAGAGGLMAKSLAGRPLMQRQLNPAEAAVFGQGDRIATSANLQLPSLTRPVNVLVLGIKVLTTDTNHPLAELKNASYQALVDNNFEGDTDTMLLLRFDPATKKLSVLSIPRDSRTYIPGHGVAKINEANADGGPALSAKSVSELLGGVGIDRYVSINVQGVQSLVDALGGVTVYVPKDLKYQDDSQHLYVNLKAGKQHLNGDQTLQLLRFRHDEYGDIGRIQRQQMVMRALMEQALNPTTIVRVPEILNVLKNHVDTNLTGEELAALTGFAAQVNRSNTQMLMLPGEFSGAGKTYETSYWLPDPQRTQAMLKQHFDFGAPILSESRPENVRVVIADSTHQINATKAVEGILQNSGYRNVSIDSPWTEPLSITRIVAQQGDINGAEAVRKSLGFGEIRIEATGNLESDVTIQLGKDALSVVKSVRQPTQGGNKLTN